MVVGVLPFGANKVSDNLFKKNVMNNQLKFPQGENAPIVTEELKDLIKKLLIKEPNKRISGSDI